jgi:hypothetical protein
VHQCYRLIGEPVVLCDEVIIGVLLTKRSYPISNTKSLIPIFERSKGGVGELAVKRRKRPFFLTDKNDVCEIYIYIYILSCVLPFFDAHSTCHFTFVFKN